jgi:hypothetical protein
MALLCLGALIGVGPGRTFASFSASTGTGGSSFSANRIFLAQRSTTAFAVSDAADATASDESNPRSYVDANFTTTGNWATSFGATRYVEFALNSPLPSGISLSDAAFSFTFADDDGAGANQFCYYFQVRKTSDNSVLATHGSSGSPVGCEAVRAMTTISTPIPSVSTTDLANDVTIRVFGQHSGSKPVRIDSARVTGTLFSNSFTLYSQRFTDSSTGTATVTPWGPAFSADGTNFQSVGNWSNAFAGTRYIDYTFPAYVPGGGTVTAASLDHSYRSATSGDTTCWYFEVYNSTTLIGSHGSSGGAISCNATTSYASENVSMPEVNTPGKANTMRVRIYMRNTGSRKSQQDLVRLNVTYSMGATGCPSPGSSTVNPTADSWTDQNAPTQNNGTNADLKVKAKSATEARRTFLKFTLATIPSQCALSTAILRLNSNTAQGTRTLDVYRASASWTEAGVTWNNQPGLAGSPASLTISGTGYKEWNVLSLVQNQYSGSNDGFVVKDSVEDSSGTTFEQKFDPRENATNRPELVITWN